LLVAPLLWSCANSTPSEDELVVELMSSGYDSVSASCFVIELRKAVGLENVRSLDELPPEQLSMVRSAADRCLFRPQAEWQRSADSPTGTVPEAPISRAEGVRQLVELGGFRQAVAECMVDVFLATGLTDLAAAFGSDADVVRLRAEAAGACGSRK